LVAGCGGGQTGDELAGDTVTQELAGTAQRLAAVGPENGGASRDNGDFAWRLLALESTPANNAVMSPYSISVAAAMLSAGAGGQTLSEIREAMSFSAEGDAFHAAHNRLLQTLDSRNRPATEDTNAQTLRLSNDLWLLPELRPSDAFLNVLSSQYGASVQLTQFDTHPEEARQAIYA
jgi:serine protease inhibitor